MHSALLFAIRLLVPAMVFAYVLAFLAAPCLPLADPSGQALAVPRWEYWLLHASVPTAIWWQWSGGNQQVIMSDRLPILVAALFWVSCCMVVGRQILRWDPVRSRLSKYERIGIAILVGHAALATFVFLFGSLMGVPLLVWAIAVLVGGMFVFSRMQQEPADGVLTSELLNDASFASSISRRMIGLLILATFFLASVQVYGATIPTRDMQVREVDWWLVKHAALDGKLHFSPDNALANAPAGFMMPAVAFASAFVLDLPPVTTPIVGSIQQRERWQGRVRLGVLAGKTVEAILGLVGVLLVGVHLGRRWGFLSGLFVGFLLIATPGLSELTRLGRTEGLVGIWVVGLLVIWQATWNSKTEKASLGVLWGFLVAGALSSGYGAAVLVGLPACCLRFWKHLRNSRSVTSSGSSRFVGILILLSACGFYVRNGMASGDPLYPWGRVAAEKLGLARASEMGRNLSSAHRVPSETVFEMVAEADTDTTIDSENKTNSPYRLANSLDGWFRLFWNSSGHGLALVPLACVGIFRCWRSLTSRLAVGWYCYWVLVWWLFSVRQDRDWMGALFLLAWPAAAGTQWLADRSQGFPMMVMVSFAICWSVVVIPIWPTSDNRMLVSLETLDQNGVGGPEAKLPDGENSVLPTYSSSFNALYRKPDSDLWKGRVLLLGENDDFDLLADCISYGPFDHKIDEMRTSPKSFREFLDSHGVSSVIVVWSGVQYREKLTGQNTESDYRSVLGEMLRDSQLRPIPWELDSSQAELLQVIKE